MIKKDLADAIYVAHGGLSHQETRAIVDRIVQSLAEHLIQGGRAVFSGFGNFQVVTRRARKGRNPRTGEEFSIPPRRALAFHPSPILVNRLNRASF